MAPQDRSTPAGSALADLTRQAVDAQVRLTREYLALARSALAREADTLAAGRAYLDSVRRESAAYAAAVSDLGLGYASGVLQAGSRGGSAVLRDVTQAVRGHPEWTSEQDVRHVAVDLRGALGETVTTRVTVANRHPDERSITLQAGAFRAEGGGATVHPHVVIDPVEVVVPAGTEREVHIDVTLDPDRFVAGHTYVGRVQVAGGQRAVVHLRIRIRPA